MNRGVLVFASIILVDAALLRRQPGGWVLRQSSVSFRCTQHGQSSKSCRPSVGGHLPVSRSRFHFRMLWPVFAGTSCPRGSELVDHDFCWPCFISVEGQLLGSVFSANGEALELSASPESCCAARHSPSVAPTPRSVHRATMPILREEAGTRGTFHLDGDVCV